MVPSPLSFGGLSRLVLGLALLGSLLLTTPGFAAKMTNADVVKMVKAGLDESLVINAVKGASEPGFDTSAEAIIALSKDGVSNNVINAVIAAGKPAAPAPASGPAAKAADAFDPEVVIMLDGEKRETMRYLVPTMRTAARGLGFGGVASYTVLRGSSAQLHTSNKQPAFLIAVPSNAQPESYVTLASFAVRKNNSREVMVGGGYMSYSSGIHPDRIMAINWEKLADQTKAPEKFTLYQITPKSPLAAGEYAVVFYTGEVQVIGFFAGGSNSCFDFAID